MPLPGSIRRRWRWGAGAFLIVFVPVAGVVHSLPDVYQSTAVVIVEPQQIPADLVRPTVTDPLEQRLQTIHQELVSRSRLEEQIARFALYQDLKRNSPLEAVVARMRSDVKLELLPGQGEGRGPVGFTVSYRGPDRDKVALVANALASSFIEGNLKWRERQAAGTAQFLRGQLQEVERRLQELEKQMFPHQARQVGVPGETEANLNTLSREYETTKETHKSLAVRVMEAALAERMEQRQKGEQFRVLEPALASAEPVAPRRLRLYAMALALALAAAAAAIRLAEGRAQGRDRRLASPDSFGSVAPPG